MICLNKLFMLLLIYSIFIIVNVNGQDQDSIESKIVGGYDVEIGNYPYQVSVRFGDQHICGGTIINTNSILTAAHCVHDLDPSLFSVRVGNTRHSAGLWYKVASVRKNTAYNPTTYDNDIAILKLNRNLVFNRFINSIDLQQHKKKVEKGTRASVSGWGVTKEGSTNVLHGLKATDVTVISNEECNRKYQGRIHITRRMLCAHTFAHDSCQGDSGGPLVANGKLIGVVSWGFGCARREYPGVYTDVSEMYGWIVNNL